MPHDVTLIIMLAAAFGGALVLGWLAHRLRLPAIVGFLAAGVLIGPATPGYVADMALASQLAEIGVMLLMFGVGLHFSLDDLVKVRGIALPARCCRWRRRWRWASAWPTGGAGPGARAWCLA